MSLKNKIENVQYKACIAITGAIQGTSREHLYHELGLESLVDRRWCRKLTFFYKIVNGLAPKYLANYLNINDDQVYKTRAALKIKILVSPVKMSGRIVFWSDMPCSYFPKFGRT